MIEKPTDKQLSFITSIEHTLHKEFDYDNATKESARRYISDNIEAYNRRKELEHVSTWALENGYL